MMREVSPNPSKLTRISENSATRPTVRKSATACDASRSRSRIQRPSARIPRFSSSSSSALRLACTSARLSVENTLVAARVVAIARRRYGLTRSGSRVLCSRDRVGQRCKRTRHQCHPLSGCDLLLHASMRQQRLHHHANRRREAFRALRRAIILALLDDHAALLRARRHRCR